MTSVERKKIRQLEKDIREMKKENRRIFGEDYVKEERKAFFDSAVRFLQNIFKFGEKGGNCK